MVARKSFLRNTAVMFTAMFISKALGAVLKIPLGNILGGEGMGYFTTAYSLFTPVLSFCCAGIPTILTRAAAEYSAGGEYGKLRTYRRCSLLTALIMGLAGTVVIYIAAVPFVSFIAGSPESLIGVLLIAPATVFCTVTAVYRGFYEGMSDTLPTAVSQVIEAFVKAVLGVGLSWIVFSEGERLFGSYEAALPYSAAAAIFGVTVSELCGMIYMLLRSRKIADKSYVIKGKPDGGELLSVCREIMIRSLPVSLGAAASNLLSLADMLTISNCIDLSADIFDRYWASDTVLSEIMQSRSGAGNFMYGCYAGIIMSVYMLVASASGVIARCALPRLTGAIQSGDKGVLKHEIKLLIKGTSVITAPVTLFMSVLGGPVLSILYPSRTAETAVSSTALSVLSAGGVAAALLGAVCVIFHAYGDFVFPIKVTLIGGAVKLILNAAFILLPFLNITGASVSAVLTNIICLIYTVVTVKKRLGISTGCVKYSIPSVTAALVGRAAVLLLGVIVYALILYITDSEDCTAVIGCLRKRRT